MNDTYIAYAVILYAIWNIVVCLIYGADKLKSKGKGQRISEKTLLILAFCMGGFGAILGMNTFRHKTQHSKFNAGVPFALLFNIGVIMAASWAYNTFAK